MLRALSTAYQAFMLEANEIQAQCDQIHEECDALRGSLSEQCQITMNQTQVIRRLKEKLKKNTHVLDLLTNKIDQLLERLIPSIPFTFQQAVAAG